MAIFRGRPTKARADRLARDREGETMRKRALEGDAARREREHPQNKRERAHTGLEISPQPA